MFSDPFDAYDAYDAYDAFDVYSHPTHPALDPSSIVDALPTDPPLPEEVNAADAADAVEAGIWNVETLAAWNEVGEAGREETEDGGFTGIAAAPTIPVPSSWAPVPLSGSRDAPVFGQPGYSPWPTHASATPSGRYPTQPTRVVPAASAAPATDMAAGGGAAEWVPDQSQTPTLPLPTASLEEGQHDGPATGQAVQRPDSPARVPQPAPQPAPQAPEGPLHGNHRGGPQDQRRAPSPPRQPRRLEPGSATSAGQRPTPLSSFGPSDTTAPYTPPLAPPTPWDATVSSPALNPRVMAVATTPGVVIVGELAGYLNAEALQRGLSPTEFAHQLGAAGVFSYRPDPQLWAALVAHARQTGEDPVALLQDALWAAQRRLPPTPAERLSRAWKRTPWGLVGCLGCAAPIVIPLALLLGIYVCFLLVAIGAALLHAVVH